MPVLGFRRYRNVLSMIILHTPYLLFLHFVILCVVLPPYLSVLGFELAENAINRITIPNKYRNEEHLAYIFNYNKTTQNYTQK